MTMKRKPGWIKQDGTRLDISSYGTDTSGMTWDHGEYGPGLKFDYVGQVYRNKNGEETEPASECFPCPLCFSPAVLLWVDCYRERYKCTNCEHEFSVK